MLLGFGLSAGAPRRAFAAFGSTLLGAGPVAGGIAVVVLMLVCGVAYVALVARERQHWLVGR